MEVERQLRYVGIALRFGNPDVTELTLHLHTTANHILFPMSDNPLFAKSQALARAVAARDGRALLVGGYVRDELLGRAPKDADVEVYGLQAPDLRATLEKLGRVDCVGESFRVYKLVWHERRTRYELDVSLPRRDRKTGEGHKGFEVEGDPFASVQDAARRRDFTVNAIMRDPLSGEIIDPFGGQTDLENRVLRAVDSAHFGEDSLRVLRAMQFAGRFGLTIEPGTVAICRATPLDDLPAERVWGEWEKWLLKSPRPSLGLRAGSDIGVFERLFPYLQRAIERRGADLERALNGAAPLLDGLQMPHQVALMLAVIGSHLGWRDCKLMLDSLGIAKMRGDKQAIDVRALVIQLVGARKTPRDWFNRHESVEDKEFRFFSARISPRLATLLSRARGDAEAADWFEGNLRRLNVFDGPPAPLLMGRHLLEMGMTPGPQIGQIVNAVYLAQLAGEVTSLDEARALVGRV